MPFLVAIAEPNATAVLLTVFGLLLVSSVVFTRALDRVGVPVVLLFLVLGMLGGSEGIGGVEFNDHRFAFRVGTIALVLILFDGGLNTAVASIRRSILPAGVLATLGVVMTAGLLALIGRALGLPWSGALLVGAIVSSTDAAAVFAVLRGGSVHLKERVRSLIEVESCVNDPMAVILTVTVIEAIRGGAPVTWQAAIDVPLQLVIGGAVGIALGWVASAILGRVRLSVGGLYPIITLSAAFVAFGIATLVQGSGFLAVYAAGVVIGHGPLPYRTGLSRIHDALAWMCQVSMFLMMGLLVFPSRLLPVAGTGILLALALAFIARPVAVMICLAPFRLSWPVVLFTAWVGLRGAVPIILGIFPIIYGLPGADSVFHIVFFIVVLSTLVPGASIRPLARRLKLDEPAPPPPAAAIEMHSLRRLKGDVRVYRIDPTLAVCGARLADIQFPEDAAAILIVRGDELIAARGHVVLQDGDHVYVFCKPEDEPYIGLLFGAPAGG